MPARDYFNSASSLALGVLLGAVGVGTGAYLTRSSWLPILSPTTEAKKEDPHAGHDHGPPGERVEGVGGHWRDLAALARTRAA